MKPRVRKKQSFKRDNASLLIPLMVAIPLTVLFAVLFFNCIRGYSEFDMEYGDLTHGELTFEKFETVHYHKSSDQYEIYFKEYSKPFYISGIVLRKVDKDSLIELKQGEAATVYYSQSSHRDYDYSICEMRCGSTAILSLQDYVEANQGNQITGMIVCSILFVCGFLCVLHLVFEFKHRREEY